MNEHPVEVAREVVNVLDPDAHVAALIGDEVHVTGGDSRQVRRRRTHEKLIAVRIRARAR